MEPVPLAPARFPNEMETQLLAALPPADRAKEEARLQHLRAESMLTRRVQRVTIDDWGLSEVALTYRHLGDSTNVEVTVEARLLRSIEGEFGPIDQVVDSKSVTVLVPATAPTTDPRAGTKVAFDLSSGAPWPARSHVELWFQNLQALA